MLRLIVDSSADYSKEELIARGIECIPLTINLEDRLYLDGVDITKDELYQWLTTTNRFPKTSQPSPQEFVDLFEDAKENGDEIICILLSSALSGTCQSAHLAKNMVDYDNIHIFDSLSVTHLIRILTDTADRMRKNGSSAGQILFALNDLQPRLRVAAAVDTLEYLCRGGRLSRASAAIGNLANLKPVVRLSADGKVDVFGKCVGRNKTMSFLINSVGKESIDTDYPFYTIYSYGTENCEALEERLRSAKISITDRKQIGATIGCHVGPGAYGVIYVAK